MTDVERIEKQRPWACKANDPACTRKQPCRPCLGRRNRRKGMVAQREVRKQVETLTATQAARFAGQLGNEEAWHGLPWIIEVKSHGIVEPAATAYRNSKKQADASRAIGDTRPFVNILRPTGGGPALAVIALEDLPAVLATIQHQP